MFGEYDVDSKLAVGSIWRMRVQVGKDADVALWGGSGLTVRSNAEGVVANPLPERTADGMRVFRLHGGRVGTTMLEARMGTGGAWASLQVQVVEKLNKRTNGDNLLALTRPHMALNAAGSPVIYTMQKNMYVPHTLSAESVVASIKSAGKLKHLVFSSHGRIIFQDGIQDSRIEIGRGLDKHNMALFSEMKWTIAGGVMWLGACGIGNDNERNRERALRAGCYLVAPVQYMQLRPGQTRVTYPMGKMDMLERFTPKVWAPNGALMAWADFLMLGSRLGFVF